MHRRQVLVSGALSLLAGPALAAGLRNPARDGLVEAFVREQNFSGVILIGRDGIASYARAFGLADIEAVRKVAVDTPFSIGSISKWFTTLAVLRLVERGRLDLTAPITRWLPGYRQDTGGKVTLRHLLSNTSGVPNLISPAIKADPNLLPSLMKATAAEMVGRFCSGDLVFEPGTKFDYAMTNWILVVAIIEKVTGRPFDQVLDTLVFKPLGLAATGCGGGADQPHRIAVGYRSVNPITRGANIRPAFLSASGNFYSTAGDLLRAANLVFDHGLLLKPATLALLTTVVVPDQDYTLGGRIDVMTLNGKPRLSAWETGSVSGSKSHLAHRLDDRTSGGDPQQHRHEPEGHRRHGQAPAGGHLEPLIPAKAGIQFHSQAQENLVKSWRAGLGPGLRRGERIGFP